MVLVDDVVFYHGRPEAGVNQIAMSLALLREPVYLAEKRIKAAFVFAAVDHDSHIKLLQELAMLLQDEEFLFLLRNHGDRDQIFRKLKEVERSNEI
jgi:mannitol/fructose-specific phosphotransferase system IIA component (Ntr-type)